MKRLTLLSAVTILAACGELQEPTAVEVPLLDEIPITESRPATAQYGAGGFILIPKAGPVSKGLFEQVAAAGGTVTGLAPAIGIAFATSNSPDFQEALEGITVIPDLLMTWEKMAEARFSDSPQAGEGDDEPYFPLQWGMEAIHAPQAWDQGSFGEGVVVAVLDGGFDLDHPDLEYAPGEASFACWQAFPGVGLILTPPPFCEDVEYGAGFDYGGGVFPPLTDPFSHATHVSGIVSALDNGVGVIGVAPEAHVLPVKVLSEYLEGGYMSWILQGILFATEAGADVINMSLEGTVDLSEVPPGERDDVMRLTVVIYRRAVNYAYQNGTTVIVAAGNDGVDADGEGHRWIRPAEFENAITVSATGPYGFLDDPEADLDRPASYTNIGKSLIDFAAPGGDFVYPGANWMYDMVLSTGALDSWFWTAGTSMASPHAAGVAALIIGEHGGRMHPARVEAEMRRRAEDLGKRGVDDYYGKGRISTGY